MLALGSHNVFDIPFVTAPMVTGCSGIAAVLMPFMFLTRVLNENKKVLVSGEKADYFGIIIDSVLIIFSLLFLYKWIFLKILAICEYIAWSFVSASDWELFLRKYIDTQNIQLDLLHLSGPAFFSAFFSTVLSVIADVFYTVRFILLAFLYIIGPLAFVCGLSPLTRTFFRNWFIAVFEISFWTILFNGMQGILTALNVSSLAENNLLMGPIINGCIISLITISIPSLTSKLLSSGNLGAIGAAAYGGLTSIGQYGKRNAAAVGKKGYDYYRYRNKEWPESSTGTSSSNGNNKENQSSTNSSSTK